MSLILILAVLLDLWLGEPQKYHPLVFFGHCVKAIEKRCLHLKHCAFKQKLYGGIALFCLVFPMTALFYLLDGESVLSQLFAAIVLYLCIAANSLKQHAMSVLKTLEANDLINARRQVAMIVSRDTRDMQFNDVRKATIESVLENGADAVFAAIFWFVLAGPAGVVMYRLSNTLDAMWGYKNQRYQHFGWAAARFDDVLNWVPARLTALTYSLLGQSFNAIYCWRHQAHYLDSPNAGPVMTAGAGALNIQLGGPAHYHGQVKNKPFFGSKVVVVNADINRAIRLVNHSLILWVLLLTVGVLLA